MKKPIESKLKVGQLLYARGADIQVATITAKKFELGAYLYTVKILERHNPIDMDWGQIRRTYDIGIQNSERTSTR